MVTVGGVSGFSLSAFCFLLSAFPSREVLGPVVLLGVGLIGVVVLLSAIIAHAALDPPRHTAGYAIARGLPMDPGELGLAFDEWRLDVPGATLPVWEITGQVPGEAEPLTAVLVHDWGRSRIDLLAEIGPWVKCCDRVMVYDLRGHGDAGGVTRLGSGDEEDLTALIGRLRRGRIVLVGDAMGAVVAIRAAAGGVGPGQVVGVVVRDPYLDLHRSLGERLKASGFPTRPLSDLAMLWLRLRGIGDRDLLADVRRLSCPLVVVQRTDNGRNDAEHIAAAARRGELVALAGTETWPTDALRQWSTPTSPEGNFPYTNSIA